VTKPRLLVVGPLPPPIHGVAISTELVLANPVLRGNFAVEHVDTSDRRSTTNIGRWDVTNVGLAARSVAALSVRLRGAPGVVYLPLSQSAPGFLRDSLMIATAAARGWKVAAHLRGGEFRQFYDRQPAPLRRWIHLTLSRVDSIAVMSESLRHVFAGLVPPERVAVVPNGTPDPGEDGYRRDGDTVLFLSNLRRRKGVREAVEAALLVLERRPRTRFLFVGGWGEPDLAPTLVARTRSAGDAIRFLPPVSGEEKRKLLLSSSVLLFPPTLPEGHPRAVLEAIAAGLPVVTTNRGAIADTVVDGECGHVLEDPVPEQLAERLLELLDTPESRRQMGRAARERYRTHFTQELADQRIAHWLRAVASEGAEAGDD
jgi:glycosyltransferase involved in cell wall biosynthesis